VEFFFNFCAFAFGWFCAELEPKNYYCLKAQHLFKKKTQQPTAKVSKSSTQKPGDVNANSFESPI